MDRDQRNLLRRAVEKARKLLEREVADQLEGIYNILPDGTIRDDAPGDPVVRSRLVDVIAHHRAAGATAPQAVERATREMAFTILNRFAALKMCEQRGLVRECISKGPLSDGVRELADGAPGLRAAAEDGGYRLVLEAIMDELSLGLKVLFDRRSPTGLIWPRPVALTELLETLNAAELAGVWGEDETIGWIYQYFNPKELRDEMRKTAAPRNTHELAVRNQFFTPRYVVEFLVDNTLGRTWYEMRKGETALKESCRYLVYEPREVFLKPGESAPEGTEQKGKTHIAHRPKKDPRDLKILDPACGSGHFLLYCFGLLQAIYEEAWADDAMPLSTATGKSLQADYTTLEALRREAPVLILKHNLYGIEIDARAAQIASLALWLRVQRAYGDLNVPPAERLTVQHTNIVVAEPIPGDKELLKEFTDSLSPPLLGQIVMSVFDSMRIAGDAGSLLKIEQLIESTLKKAKEAWIASSRREQLGLFPEYQLPKQGQLDLSGITEEAFWRQAEDRIYASLRIYSESAVNGSGFRRALFAHDAAQGFAFIDVCRQLYDVVLMNPPFGAFSLRSKDYAGHAYPASASDMFAAFVDRFLSKLGDLGLLGAISSRTGFFITSLADWRRDVVSKRARMTCFADLGGGVMDTATVEAAAYVLKPTDGRADSERPCPYFRLLVDEPKHHSLAESIGAVRAGERQEGKLFWAEQARFSILPDSPLVYWIQRGTLEKFAHLPRFEPHVAQVRKGLRTGDNFRFVRALWEIPLAHFTPEAPSSGELGWVPLVLSGSSQPWFSPLLVALNWRRNGAELRQYVTKYGSVSRLIQAEDFYFRPGMSWTLRAARFVPYAVPQGCIPTGSRPMAFPVEGAERLGLGLSASRVASAYMRFYGDWFSRPKFLEGKLKLVPWPNLSTDVGRRIERFVSDQYKQRRKAYQGHEPFFEFIKPYYLTDDVTTVSIDWHSLLTPELETAIAEAYGIESSEATELYRDLDEALSIRRVGAASDVEDEEGNGDEGDDTEAVLDYSEHSCFGGLISYAVGCAFGRWDIRFGTGELTPAESVDPFAPLPQCPPGMLKGELGLPLTEDYVRKQRAVGKWKYPLDIPWDGLLLNDVGDAIDIVERTRLVLAAICKQNYEAVLTKACKALGVPDLRTYLAKPGGFFADHLKRYTKSRRKAPIYWPLSTASGRYSVWIYYPRLTVDTLYKVVTEHVSPKIGKIEDRMAQLESAEGKRSGREAGQATKELAEMAEFLAELKVMREELVRLVNLPYRPDLNDGVQITAAPLWQLFRLPRWRGDLEKTWKALEKGEYDWAHLAYAIWPDRVKEKCKTDKSLAIAHGLESLYEEPQNGKPRERRGAG